MISKEALIGRWRTFKVVWRGTTIEQGTSNYTLLNFMEGNRLIFTAVVGERAFVEKEECIWDIHVNFNTVFIVLDGIPHYEIIQFAVNNLVLKSKSEILLYFKREMD